MKYENQLVVDVYSFLFTHSVLLCQSRSTHARTHLISNFISWIFFVARSSDVYGPGP